MTSCFYVLGAANPFCQRGFIPNQSACDTLARNASLSKSSMHSVVHGVHRLQKEPQGLSLSSQMGSERLCFHREDAHQMRGWERARCQESPGSCIAFQAHKQNRAFVVFVFLNTSAVGLNYWSRVYCCHAGKLPQEMFASYSAILNSFSLGFKG